MFCPAAVQGCSASNGTITSAGVSSSVIFDLRGQVAVSIYIRGSGGSAGTLQFECSNDNVSANMVPCGPVYTISDAVPLAISASRTNFGRINMLTLTSGSVAGVLTRETK